MSNQNGCSILMKGLSETFQSEIRPSVLYEMILYILSYLFRLFCSSRTEQVAPSDGQTEQVVGFVMNSKYQAKGKNSLYGPHAQTN